MYFLHLGKISKCRGRLPVTSCRRFYCCASSQLLVTKCLCGRNERSHGWTTGKCDTVETVGRKGWEEKGEVIALP